MAGIANFFKALYSLDTLDTRLTTAATAPQKDIKRDGQLQEPDRATVAPLPDANPSKWRTPEYFFYYFCFITLVPAMVKQVYDISQPGSPGWDEYSKRLSPGWIPGRKVDNSDAQYATFRDHIGYMTAVLIIHPVLRKLYNSFWRVDSYAPPTPANGSPSKLTQGLPASAAAEARLQHRVTFDLYFGVLFILALNGVSASKVFLIFYVNFKVATQFQRSYVPAATWIFNIGILFANELCRGYPFAGIARTFAPGNKAAADLGAALDGYGGLNPRWEVLFNLSVLRLISFNMDHYWAAARGASSPVEHKKKQLDPSLSSERDRVTSGASLRDFTMKNYFAYALYSPLYLTGPILTFNDYISQSRYPLPSVTTIRTFLYGIRFLLILLCMELVLHFTYAVAIIKTSPDWSQYSAFQLSMLGYFNLHIIWLKLLIPWRFFRFWSLLDGIDPPENMIRCMSDNYSALAFWRGWHRSLNRWIVRYIFIPIGGSGGGKVRALFNFLTVFMFVAVWHDINLQMLAWGWLITLFVVPEVVAMILFPKKKWKDWPESYRVLCGVGAVGNILMMMVANLVGFVIGVDGVKEMVRGIVAGWSGIGFVVAACATLFVGVQVMFEHREEEKRQGINLKC